MDIFYGNRVFDSGVTATASSENELLQAENLLRESRAKIWRTGTSTAAESVVFNLQTAGATIADVIIDGYDSDLAGAVVKIEANASDSWGSPSVSETISSSKFSFGLPAVHELPSAVSYQYWRLSVTKASAGVAADVGHIYLGSKADLNEWPDHDGVAHGVADLSEVQMSRGGTSFVDERPRVREWTVPFSMITATKAQLDNLALDGALHEPFWMHLTDVAGDTTLSEYVYVRNRSVPRFLNKSYTGSAWVWDVELDVMEVL